MDHDRQTTAHQRRINGASTAHQRHINGTSLGTTQDHKDRAIFDAIAERDHGKARLLQVDFSPLKLPGDTPTNIINRLAKGLQTHKSTIVATCRQHKELAESQATNRGA